MQYDEFKKEVSKKIKNEEITYKELIENIINYPERYVGTFRLSSAKTKIIQNITQSREIKFGDILESIVQKEIECNGYKILRRTLEMDNGEIVNIDQHFESETSIFIVEQKIRDDHDSTKKRGQFDNFIKKIDLFVGTSKKLKAYMWFIDPDMKKNRKYYKQRINDMKENPRYYDIDIDIFYGDEFFKKIFESEKEWFDLINNIERYKQENDFEVSDLPDFGSSEQIKKALMIIGNLEWKKLSSSNDERYIKIRKTIFNNGENIEIVKKERG